MSLNYHFLSSNSDSIHNLISQDNKLMNEVVFESARIPQGKEQLKARYSNYVQVGDISK